MNSIKNLIEYYDELYPITREISAFYDRAVSRYESPAKILRIGCGTGKLEYALAQKGCDVTAIDAFGEMIRFASKRKLRGQTSLRFFKMSMAEMRLFLAKGFYNIISCINNRLIFICNADCMDRFFEDCRSLLTKDGVLILELANYGLISTRANIELPDLAGIRVRLVSSFDKDGDEWVLHQCLKSSGGKIFPVLTNEKVYPVTVPQLCRAAERAGFSQIVCYEDFSCREFCERSPSVVCEIFV